MSRHRRTLLGFLGRAGFGGQRWNGRRRYLSRDYKLDRRLLQPIASSAAPLDAIRTVIGGPPRMQSSQTSTSMILSLGMNLGRLITTAVPVRRACGSLPSAG